MASHEVRTQIVSNDKGVEFLAIGVSNPDDPYDGATLTFTAEEAHVFVKQVQDAMSQWKGEPFMRSRKRNKKGR